MKSKITFLLLIAVVILAGCVNKEMNGSTITLLNQEKQEITFPQEKPSLFFFITTYT